VIGDKRDVFVGKVVGDSGVVYHPTKLSHGVTSKEGKFKLSKTTEIIFFDSGDKI
jgi:hypothetical protein